MKRLKALLIALHEDETAVTATEYVVVLVLISCGSILALQLLGGWKEHDTEEDDIIRHTFARLSEGMSSRKIRGGLSVDAD